MKGNLFLGFGRKSVGDVVFYKRKGSTEQMARARNRKPNNPRSDKQLYQRAIMATVLQAYSAGKAIFDHSFEGKSVPDGSMRRFMSLNLRKLRAAIAEDLSVSSTNPTPGRVVAPGAVTPVPFAYRISEGSYVNQLLTYDDTTPGALGFKFPTPDAADTTPALYLSNHGFIPGDIYTIVAFGNDPDNVIGIYPDGSLYGCYFGWVRLQVRADAPSSGALTLDNLFIVTSSNGIDDTIQAGSIIAISDVFDNVNFVTGSIGAIRSRYDSGVRSTSDMYMIGADDFGIASTDLLDVWRAGTQQVGEPELILEGATNNQPRTNPTTPEDLGTLSAVIAGTTVNPASLTNSVTESTNGTAEAISRVDFKIKNGDGQIVQRGNNSMVAVAIQNGRVIASTEAMGAQAEVSLGLNSIAQEFQAAPVVLKMMFNGRDSGLAITMTYESGD